MWASTPALLVLAASCSGRGSLAGRDGGSGGGAAGGAPGAGGAQAACTGPDDPRLVVAPQRILLLTIPQVVGTVGYLLGEAAAERVRSSPEVQAAASAPRRFPPASGEDAVISEGAVISRDQVGQIVGHYLRQNFGDVTRCVPATDRCALDFLHVMATRAYRRQLGADEWAGLQELYAKLRQQVVNGYQITASVEEATQYAVYALVTSPQLLWRYEVGEPGVAAAPAVRLSDDELASAVSFFLTDRPPDEALLADARAGTLHTTLAAHVARILDTPEARGWLRAVMEIYFQLNRLPATKVGDQPGLAPEMTATVLGDMQTESRMFLDRALWGGELGELVSSRVTFLNTRLATAIYDVAPPAGATDMTFVETTLPRDQRAGLFTNAGYLTTNATAGRATVGTRGLQAAAALLCAAAPSLTAADPAFGEQAAQIAKLDTTSAQQQVAARRKSECSGCHANMDAVGVVLDAYDGIGRHRTVDNLGQPVDTHTPLPPIVGAGSVDGAAAMADAIARSPAFTACMARVVLQQAITDDSAPVDVALPPAPAGCAVADLAARFAGGSDKTFGALVRAVATSPAFVLRRP